MKSTKSIALVSGASSGIGTATAGRLPAAGYAVYGTSRPATLANPDVVLQAALAARPKLRYTAGGRARGLQRLRRFAPARLLDAGIRKDLQLDALPMGKPS